VNPHLNLIKVAHGVKVYLDVAVVLPCTKLFNGNNWMNYHFRITKEENGYSAQCIEIPGCITEADSKKELYANMKEALELYIQEPESSFDLAPLLKIDIVEVPLDHSKETIL
jgi:predicted RNase H-like HicB family nuclease